MKTGFKWVLYFWGYCVGVAAAVTILMNLTKRFGEKAMVIGFGLCFVVSIAGAIFHFGYEYQKRFPEEHDGR